MFGGFPLILVLYINDLIFTVDDSFIWDCKEDLAKEFEMNDMGLVLQKFHMQDCSPMATPLVTNWRKMGTTTTE